MLCAFAVLLLSFKKKLHCFPLAAHVSSVKSLLFLFACILKDMSDLKDKDEFSIMFLCFVYLNVFCSALISHENCKMIYLVGAFRAGVLIVA